ncbi:MULTISPECIES: hypothetical protein [unclassified Streptomyces]|uniref:hypothetical protein n=1 Tax=unclassified Streptomyces TaxID=2593676 RepID=UPI000A99A1EC|nr:hypothetical protein [Streptomyces sp. CB01883]
MAAAIFPAGTEHAPEITRQLTTRFADEFGYAVDDLLLYRAAYAMATSDAFAPGGGDETRCGSCRTGPGAAYRHRRVPRVRARPDPCRSDLSAPHGFVHPIS